MEVRGGLHGSRRLTAVMPHTRFARGPAPLSYQVKDLDIGAAPGRHLTVPSAAREALSAFNADYLKTGKKQGTDLVMEAPPTAHGEENVQTSMCTRRAPRIHPSCLFFGPRTRATFR